MAEGRAWASRSVRPSSRRTVGTSGPRTCPREAWRSSSHYRWSARHRPRFPRMPDPVVVLVELGLPDMDGLDVIRHVREWSGVPIIVLSARGQERDKVAALDAGADD